MNAHNYYFISKEPVLTIVVQTHRRSYQSQSLFSTYLARLLHVLIVIKQNLSLQRYCPPLSGCHLSHVHTFFHTVTTCASPPDVTGSTFSCSGNVNYGDTCTLTCDTGYTGARTLNCNQHTAGDATSTWDDDSTCTGINLYLQLNSNTEHRL